MPEPDLLALFARPLHNVGIRYLVAGSMGAMLYGEPRLTLDIDLAVALADTDLSSLPKLFPEPDFYTPPPEVLAAENARECRAHFNVIHIPSGLKADFYPSQRDPFFAWAWSARNTTSTPDGPVHFAPAEYIVVWKVAYFEEGGSEKHVRDIQRLMDLSGHEIDRTRLEAELDRRRLTLTFKRMLGPERSA